MTLNTKSTRAAAAPKRVSHPNASTKKELDTAAVAHKLKSERCVCGITRNLLFKYPSNTFSSWPTDISTAKPRWLQRQLPSTEKHKMTRKSTVLGIEILRNRLYSRSFKDVTACTLARYWHLFQPTNLEEPPYRVFQLENKNKNCEYHHSKSHPRNTLSTRLLLRRLPMMHLLPSSLDG